MRKKTFLFFLLGLLTVLCLAVPAWANAASIGTAAPATVNINQEFDVNVQVNDVANLAAVEFKLSYDPNILEALSITKGVPVKATVFKEDITTESVWFASSVLKQADVYTGSGTVATVKFKAKGAGQSTLALSGTVLGYWDGTGTGSITHNILPSATVNVVQVVAPTVQTNGATSLATTSATLNGNITNTGGQNCDQRKFRYRQQGAVDWTDAGSETGSFGTGAFSFSLTGLTSNTAYEVKALAHNSAGWGEGAVVSFTTTQQIVAPTVQTNGATSLATTSATLNGNITNTGGQNCDQRKFRYRQQGAVDWTDAGSETGSFGTGAFSFNLTGLTPGATYEVKALAHNTAGWGEGTVVSFTTATTPGELSIDVNLSLEEDISFTRPLIITGTATGPGAENVAWQVEIKDGGVVVASYTPANGASFTQEYKPVEDLPVVGDYSVRVVATPGAGAPVTKEVAFNIYNYPLKVTALNVTGSGATRTLTATIKNLEASAQDVRGICQITGPGGNVVFLELANEIKINDNGSQEIGFTTNALSSGTYKAELFIWLSNEQTVWRTMGTPGEATFTI